MPERILVAEDKENLCRLIETTLSEQGYDVSIALGGDAAIHEIQGKEAAKQPLAPNMQKPAS